MTIQTRFKIGDSVYYYIKEKNKYATGKIERINIDVDEEITTEYYVENKFYRYDEFCFGSDIFEHKSSLVFEEGEVFKTADELRFALKVKHEDKMSKLEELKRGFRLW